MNLEEMAANTTKHEAMNETVHILKTSLFGNNSVSSTTYGTSNNIHVMKAVVCLAVIPILAFVGIFGNISTVIVFYSKKQKHASSIFIIGLAFADLIFLVLRFTANIYSICHIFFTEIFRYIRPYSLFWFLLSKTPQRIGNVFVVLIVLERFTAVWFPFQVRRVWTGKRSLRISIVLIFVAFGGMVHAIDSLIFSFNERVQENVKLSTDFEAMRYSKYCGKFVFIWLNTYRVVFDMLPIPTVSIFNILIPIGIKRNSFSKILNACAKQRKGNEMRTTRMLLTISVLFVLLCGPFQVLFILLVSRQIGFSDVVLTESFLMLNILNSVINFVVYGINDNSLRSKYLEIWKCQQRASVDSNSYVKTN